MYDQVNFDSKKYDVLNIDTSFLTIFMKLGEVVVLIMFLLQLKKAQTYAMTFECTKFFKPGHIF